MDQPLSCVARAGRRRGSDEQEDHTTCDESKSSMDAVK
jgi:hypothetical protein